MESDLESVRSRLSGLLGSALSDADVADVLAAVIGGGGGVLIELDENTRYKLIRRDGRFVLSKDARARLSSVPPRRF